MKKKPLKLQVINMPPEMPELWPTWADSIAHAERITKIPRQTHSRFRREGCEAYKGNGKVNLGELRAWMDANGKTAGPEPAELTAARIRVLNATAERIERENKKKAGEIAMRSDVVNGLGHIMGAIFSGLDRMAYELPPTVKGLSEREIHNKFNEQIAKFKISLAAKFESLERGE